MKTMNIPFSPPDITEEEISAVSEALRSGWITTGPKTKLLESRIADYLGTKKVVCLNSATAGLELSLRILGVGVGDEVIVPAMTYTASCSVIEHVGATPVIVDIQESSHQFSFDALKNAITDKTKVIIPVDLAGIPCDYESLFKIVEEKSSIFKANSQLQNKIGRITILADGAHAFGAKYKDKMVGQVADMTVFSFHAVKNFTTAEGGAVTWFNDSLNDEDLYKQFQIFSLHGQTKDALEKTKIGSWEYDILIPGYKCNMTDIMASIGLVQLDRYPNLLEIRREIVETYNKGFQGTIVKPLPHLSETSEYESSNHLYIVHLDGFTQSERNKVIEEMAQKGIACNVHYKPLPMLTAYKNMGFDVNDYPNAYHYFENTLTLPLHTKLSNEEVNYVVENLNSITQGIQNEK
ncbi:DegT/DnrJ/EryC1/StrS family aminotransferase [Streptococcus parauberis]|uniref:Aminotransferase n=2 Tax=Streptococcus parauberis TaxID=1348 RepID=A0A0S3TG34_9STRE|nr:DegT/DnrJ/EryC1/StrS family aminotransferase [Streptococcus parauberis]EMF49995.1 UDP-4-amino-4-deoxy-L-arabinose--oxoglutarate aminotransferase [Streptococcus parauberis KRS-02109]UWM86176.1 DegT/DnrJ/EryC1/StrS family aminotransferase [Streptococcus parauberis]UWM88147.1 DegT/DnrJ/EryC1/StrS family aminotransferase [Streptococcus parauberis]WEM58985.1 DegT/DnrJ/EryC1/StrS family aminotransferase [Streptococcus parauberis]BAU04053.1 aminotransferase [Streptococcus parauberis]